MLLGDLHILDENMNACPAGTAGTVWFKTATPFEYFNDPNKTKEARSPDGGMSTVGDVRYVDDDGYLYLTDRATFMIISGGVNILSAGMREPPDHPPEDRGRRCVRRSQFRSRRGSQSGGTADAGD
jgi:acyl-CoA synthetase (AMP-forming)/AMP-acid ligase II